MTQDTDLELCLQGIYESSRTPLYEYEYDHAPAVVVCINALTQTYFNKLCDTKREKNKNARMRAWREQSYTLEKLLTASAMASKGWWIDHDKNMLNVAKWFVAHVERSARSLIGDSKVGYSSRINLNSEECVAYMNALEKLTHTGKIDEVVFVASAGQPLASLFSYSIGKLPMGVRYSHLKRSDKRVLYPANAGIKYYKERLRDKNVLVIDDILDSDETLRKVNDFMKGLGARNVYLTACLARKECLLQKSGYEVISRHGDYGYIILKYKGWARKLCENFANLVSINKK